MSISDNRNMSHLKAVGKHEYRCKPFEKIFVKMEMKILKLIVSGYCSTPGYLRVKV